MPDQKPQLTKSQLAAIDMMIAHMQENNKSHMDGFFGSIVSAVTNTVSSATNIYSNAQKNTMMVVGNLAGQAVQGVGNAATSAANSAKSAVTNAATNVGSNVASAANNLTSDGAHLFGGGGWSDSVNEHISGLVGQLQGQGVENMLTLENLIKIRNQYAK